MDRWRAVVFDLDDTLYPEREFVLGGFMAAARWAEARVGIHADVGYADLCRLYESGVRGDTFERWLEEHGVEPGPHVSSLVDVYRRHEPRLEPFPGVPALLAGLGRDHLVGLISDGLHDVQRRKLNALGLGPVFDAVVFSDEWGRENWKPSTRPFLEILQRLGVTADSAVYVADNPLKDFLGARQVGMHAIQILREGGEYARATAPTPQHAADRVIHDLSVLERLVAGTSPESDAEAERP